MMRPCDDCGELYAAKSAKSRYCSDRCRQRANRRGGPLNAAGIVTITDVEPGGVATAVRRELEDANALDTADGALALALADRIDSRSETGSAVASLSRQLLAALDRAKQRAPRPDSALDRIRARRDARIAEATAARRAAQ